MDGHDDGGTRLSVCLYLYFGQAKAAARVCLFCLCVRLKGFFTLYTRRKEKTRTPSRVLNNVSATVDPTSRPPSLSLPPTLFFSFHSFRFVLSTCWLEQHSS